MADPEIDPSTPKNSSEPDAPLAHGFRRYLPKNPDVRDWIMGTLGIILSGLLGILVATFLNNWIGIAIMSIGIGHFTMHYWIRVWDRSDKRKKTNMADRD